MKQLKIFDLSVPLEEGMPYFKGDPIPEIRQFKSIKDNGYNLKELKIGTHTGTHVDAPSHFIENGKTIDQLDLSDLMGSATCLSYDPFRQLKLPEEHYDIIFLYTGYNLSWGKFKTFENFSYIKDKDAGSLRNYGVKVVGIDSPSAEIQNSKSFDVHRILLGNSIPIVENLNSVTLSGLVDHSFTVQVMPILVKGGDGAPARVIAIEE
jgi:arylformamidase